ncbi:hypothetical protein L292_0791 [Acinetobacter junii CIP 107470 = MTCC 11364]|uniref:Uncharacterized protein n=1 Tax=Acinetobacter junii CIP 107470 = MTCC 11364 TaxID=1217666 RepID=S7WKT6_ACIJU|nr:hypothetical protein [Acinetobacter junii]ENV51582.1 hypothetical protein F953_01066 [Acinetobacter junii CIP 107470 = MTCC 11364]EPR82477.1 hypothetical protein L292_0791 [Acinetobacter junii CIP 107470 = MTCC 11364]
MKRKKSLRLVKQPKKTLTITQQLSGILAHVKSDDDKSSYYKYLAKKYQ